MKHFNFILPSDQYWCRFGITGVIRDVSFTLGVFTRQWWDGFFYEVKSDGSEKWHTLGLGLGYLSWVNNEDIKK